MIDTVAPQPVRDESYPRGTLDMVAHPQLPAHVRDPLREKILDARRVAKKNRIEALLQLGEIGGVIEVLAITQVLAGDPRKSVRRTAADVLGVLGGPQATKALLESLENIDEKRVVRTAAFKALLHLATNGWENYRKRPVLFPLPNWLRRRFLAVRDDKKLWRRVHKALTLTLGERD